MSKYSRKNIISEETIDDAQKIARASQRPGQTKEQTKLIAQGIQKGIDLYKKQQKTKARELDRKIRKVSANQKAIVSSTDYSAKQEPEKNSKLAWILLALSWLVFFTYILLTKTSYV